jgi:hypothetical protein
MPEPAVVALLSLAAFVAGMLDAIAGGGGLVTVPALLAAGLPPHVALGTNKGQSVFGPVAALLRYARAGLVDSRRARVVFPLAFAGALLGARLVLVLPPEQLRPVVLGLLVAVAAWLAARRGELVAASAPQAHPRRIAAAIALLVGAYDGFFGPGTGTFLIVAFARLLGDRLDRASANAKVANFASNLAAVALFGVRGAVLWQLVLPMALAQFAGGFAGAHLAVRGGARTVRGLVLLVVVALVGKLAWDALR